MIRFLIDEDNSTQVAVIGRNLGLDVVHLLDLGRGGSDDEFVLRLAAQSARCVVTKNDRDFPRLTELFQLQGDAHAGVLLIAPSLDRRHTARIAHALVAYAALHPDGLPAYMLDYLNPAPHD